MYWANYINGPCSPAWDRPKVELSRNPKLGAPPVASITSTAKDEAVVIYMNTLVLYGVICAKK